MKYKTARDMAVGLRWLADFIEEQGIELPSDYGCSDPDVRLVIYTSSKTDKKKIVQATKALASQGIVKKDFVVDAKVVKDFGKHVKLTVRFNRESVCTPKVVGTKEVEEELYVKTGRKITQDVIEWECHPILADV